MRENLAILDSGPMNGAEMSGCAASSEFVSPPPQAQLSTAASPFSDERDISTTYT